MTNSKRGMIPPYLLFCLFFVSRVVVTLTYVQGVSVGDFGVDILISLAISFAMLMAFSVPVYACIKKNRTPLDNKLVSVLYSVYFCFYASITVSRFAFFSSSRMNTDMPMLVIILMVSIAMCYGAYLGIESIGRFGLICAIFLSLALITVLILNVSNLYEPNFYPLINNKTEDILKNAVLFTSNSVAPVYALVLSQRVNGKIYKTYIFSLLTSYVAIALLVLFCAGVMGSSSNLHSYPIYTLFQLASVGAFSRLDMLHTAFWILAVLLKSSLLIYCASITLKGKNHMTKCVIFALITFALALVSTDVLGTNALPLVKMISVIFFCVFSILIPLVSSVVRRKNEEK